MTLVSSVAVFFFRVAMNDFRYRSVYPFVEIDDEVNFSVRSIGVNGGLFSDVTMKTLGSLVVTIFIGIADEESEEISSTLMFS